MCDVEGYVFVAIGDGAHSTPFYTRDGAAAGISGGLLWLRPHPCKVGLRQAIPSQLQSSLYTDNPYSPQ